MRDDMSHCPHPARNGRHEVYARPDGSTFCRACGEEFGIGPWYHIALDQYKGEVGPSYPEVTMPDDLGEAPAHIARKGKE